MADGSPVLLLPSSNRGVSDSGKPQTFNVLIDWLAASVDLPAVLAEQGWDDSMKDTLDILDTTGANAMRVADAVAAFFLGGTGITLADEVRAGRFYSWRVGLKSPAGEHVGLIEFGGANTVRKDGVYTSRIELTGTGCRIYEGAGAAGSDHAKRWLELRAKLESCAGRLTRVDVAADDLAGINPVSWAISIYHDGEFNNRGQKPKPQHIDDFGSGDGSTFYVGSVKSEKRLRVYEKGKQLGDPESPWVRYEAQFTNSKRKELPLDMLRDPASYFLGEYPALRFLNAIARRIDVTDAAAISTLKSARRHFRRQYGRTCNFIIRNCADDAQIAYVFRSLAADKPPDWAAQHTGADWPEIQHLISSQETPQ